MGQRCGPERRHPEKGAEQSRLKIPNDSIVISGPRRAWAATPQLSKGKIGPADKHRMRTAEASMEIGTCTRNPKLFRVRALTPELSCKGIK